MYENGGTKGMKQINQELSFGGSPGFDPLVGPKPMPKINFFRIWSGCVSNEANNNILAMSSLLYIHPKVIFFESSHVAYQINGNDAQNTMQA